MNKILLFVFVAYSIFQLTFDLATEAEVTNWRNLSNKLFFLLSLFWGIKKYACAPFSFIICEIYLNAL